MKALLLAMACVIAQTITGLASDGPVNWDKLASVEDSRISISIDLHHQTLSVLDLGKVVCTSPCTTAPIEYIGDDGKPFRYPSQTTLVATGKGQDGMRVSGQFGATEMPSFLELDMRIGNALRGVGIHARSSEKVPRIPASHGCIGLPKSIAKVLFEKLTEKGKLKRQYAVVFLGTQRPLLGY